MNREEQREALLRELDLWRGGQEQTDEITILGIRF